MLAPDDTSDRRLRQIADLLGVPVERFFDECAPERARETSECLRLWESLATAAGRAAALDALRRAVASERA